MELRFSAAYQGDASDLAEKLIWNLKQFLKLYKANLPDGWKSALQVHVCANHEQFYNGGSRFSPFFELYE